MLNKLPAGIRTQRHFHFQETLPRSIARHPTAVTTLYHTTLYTDLIHPLRHQDIPADKTPSRQPVF